MKKAIEHPQAHGTTEQDFVEYFTRLVKKDPEGLCTTLRQSKSSAVSP